MSEGAPEPARPSSDGAPEPTRTSSELLRALAHLAEPPGPAHGPLAAALELPDPPDRAGHEALFGFQLYPWASVYLGAEGMLGGEALRRVAGFWRAVGREAPKDPDHLASLLGLYAALMDEEAEVRSDDTPAAPARAELVARSRRALLEEHLAPWIFAFLERVRELGGSFHTAWAELLAAILEDEVGAGGPLDRVPTVLEDVPSLPDPRSGGAGAFLGGLLTPAVSGLILTRADLARIAAERDLGLRAGERRYALEHLLGQEASVVLLGIADEAHRQASAHRARADRLGIGAGWTAERAAATEDILRNLAESADELLVATSDPRDS
ncbi:MAG: molecular chaperone TorD family protein [Gemmatimonadota bacterium]